MADFFAEGLQATLMAGMVTGFGDFLTFIKTA